jgi:transposase
VYLAAWLNTQDAQQQIGGSRVTGTISNLSLTSIRNLLLPIPDRLSQQRFADRMLGVKRLIENVETSATALDMVFAALQHRAFRGES